MEANLDLSCLSLNKRPTENNDAEKDDCTKDKLVTNAVECETKIKEQKNSSKTLIRELKGALLVIIAVFLFSLSAIFMKFSFTLNFADHLVIRFLLQITVFYSICKFKSFKINAIKKQQKLLIIYGALCTIILIAYYLALVFVHPSDLITIANVSLIVTSILSRLFLKEKLTLIHLIVFLFCIFGIIVIARPPYLLRYFVKNESNYTLNATNCTSKFNFISNEQLDNYIGISLALISALLMGITNLFLKKFATFNISYAITSLYPTFFGLPLSITIALLMIIFGLSHKTINEEKQYYLSHILYSFFAALCGVLGIALFNISYRYEETTKIAIIKTIDVFFTFLLQYIFLKINFDIFSVVGAIFIIGTIIVLMFVKLFATQLTNSNCIFRFLVKKF